MSAITQAVESLRRGGIVIVTDHKDRENEGDFLFAAQYATPKKVNFLLTLGKGLVCAPLTEKRAYDLDLPKMVANEKNTESTKCKFTVSVDLKKGTTTGISAKDRSATLRALANLKMNPSDFARPGHIFPLIAQDGGVLKRMGHTEAAIDLLRISRLTEVGVICEILNEQGSAAGQKELKVLAKKYALPLVSIGDLMEHRKKHG